MTKRLLIFLAIALTLLACGPLAGVSAQQSRPTHTLAPHAQLPSHSAPLRGLAWRALPGSAGVTPQSVETPTSSNIVKVSENEFSLTFQPAQPSAGEITFVVENQGHIPHDFRIYGNGIDQHTSMILPQQSANLTLQLKPGAYEYKCTIEGHDMAGMHGTLTIKASSSS